MSFARHRIEKAWRKRLVARSHTEDLLGSRMCPWPVTCLIEPVDILVEYASQDEIDGSAACRDKRTPCSLMNFRRNRL